MRGYGSPRAGRHGPKACGSPSLHAVKYRCRKTMRRPTKEWMRDSGVVVSRTYCRDGDGVVALFPPAAPFFSRRRLLGSPARNSAGASVLSVRTLRSYSLSAQSVRPIRVQPLSAKKRCKPLRPPPLAKERPRQICRGRSFVVGCSLMPEPSFRSPRPDGGKPCRSR